MGAEFRLSNLSARDIHALLFADRATLTEEQAGALERFITRAGGLEQAKQIVDLLIEMEDERCY